MHTYFCKVLCGCCVNHWLICLLPHFLTSSLFSLFQGMIVVLMQCFIWSIGVARRYPLPQYVCFFHSSSFSLPLMPMFLSHFACFFILSYYFFQVMMVDNRKHDISLLLLSQINKILMDDFVREHCSTCVETSLIISNSLVNIVILCILYLGFVFSGSLCVLCVWMSKHDFVMRNWNCYVIPMFVKTMFN